MILFTIVIPLINQEFRYGLFTSADQGALTFLLGDVYQLVDQAGGVGS
jgi:hypothetical protein